ncbi:hypothetical protein ACHHYP_06230, partial [Achlya hypogyna]
MKIFTLLALPATVMAQCAENGSQCNGQNWPYGVCCKDPNYSCNYKNQYLSLCEPKAPETKPCAEKYSQCNGQNWPFGVCCKDPNFSCNYKNQYLSLCEPKKQAMETEGQVCAE